ncbi:Rho GTPase activating protein 4 [Chamberlinius hualienensis]
MALDKKIQRRDKELLFELEGQVKDIRQQLNEQSKCLDMRMETQVYVVNEIQDFFKKRAEVELEYSRMLDKLVKSVVTRHKTERQKREQWHLFSTYSCWEHLIQRTKQCSKQHAVLSEIYSNNITNRFSTAIEDVQRIYRKCRETGIEGQEEIMKVLHELHASMKTYQTYHNEMLLADQKVRLVQGQQLKIEQSVPKEKLEKSKKYRLIEKEKQKRLLKYQDANVKALKARNEYLMGMDAANSAIRKFFADDTSDLIDCMDFGFHNTMARAFLTYISAEDVLKNSMQQDVDAVYKCISNLDSRLDKQRFLEYNNSAFMIPKKFEFQGRKGDERSQVQSNEFIQDEMDQRFKQLCKRLTTLKMEGEEIWKTLETAEKSLMDMINVKDYDCSLLFDEELSNKNGQKLPETITLKLRADRQETEDFYLNKFREYMLGNNLMVRLQSKYDTMRRALALGEQDSGKDSTYSLSSTSASTSESSIANQSVVNRPFHRNSFLSQKPRRKRIGRTPMVGQPKLFGGSLEEYLEATNQEIPLIMKSTIRIINLYGLHHQGIFRVSGSQVEINHFKEAFERNEDPLADMSDASDINSVAGVLKLYLRELREPMFPIYYFDQLLQISRLESKAEFVAKLKDLVASFPRPVYIVMRYLFAFLNHLSEYSDENMMDPYNLAICFGPTLLPIPEDKDQVQYQNLVNELVKNIIMYQEDIFPQDGGVVYEKYISPETPDENDVEDLPVEPIIEEGSEANLASVEDGLKEKEIHLHIFGKSETLEAVAQFDFTARSEREISFKKGDTLRLHTQVSNDWWKGSFENQTGLIPDKYILIKIKDEDKGGSDENMRRTSSSSDSLSPGLKSPASFQAQSKSSISTGKLEETSEHSVSFSNHASLSQSKSTPLIGQRSPTVNQKFDTLAASVNVEDDAKNDRSSSATEITVHMSRPASNNRPKEVATVTVVHGKRPTAAERAAIADTISAITDVGSTPIDEDDFSPTESSVDVPCKSDHVLASAYSNIDSMASFGDNVYQQSKKSLIKDTPDLVMDLPTVGSSNASSPSSSVVRAKQDDVEVMSTAERFAISNQGTVKKNSRTISSSSSEGSRGGDVQSSRSTSVAISVSAPASPCKPVFESPLSTYSSMNVSTFKPRITSPSEPPPVKAKPPVMKKPLPSNNLTHGLGSSSADKLRPILDCKELKQTSC